MAKSIDMAGSVDNNLTALSDACDLTVALVENGQEKGKLIKKFMISGGITVALGAAGGVVSGGNPIGASAGAIIGSVIGDIVSKKV